MANQQYTRVVENLVLSDTLRIEGAEWNNTLIRNVTIKGASGDGIFLRDVSNVRIENSTIENVGGSGIRLSSSGSTSDVTIANNTIKNVTANGISAAQRFEDGVDHLGLKVLNNRIDTTGLSKAGGYDHGIYVQTSDFLIEGNTVLNSVDGNGISVRSSGIVRSNVVDGAGKSGIAYYSDHMRGPSDKLVIDNNYVRDWGQNKDLSGIDLKSSDTSQAVHNFILSNNHFYGNSSDWVGVADDYNSSSFSIKTSGSVSWDGSGTPSVPDTTPAPNPTPTPAPDTPDTVVTNGTSGDDRFTGTSGADKYNGNGGNDRIAAKDGNDVLSGGSGKDTFVFDSKLNASKNIDKITDFSVKDDTINLDDAIFAKISKGKMESSAFWTGAKAHDSSDRIIYDNKTGVLYFDADGTGSGQQVKFAEINKSLALKSTDFYVF
jgi:parallel beta-helix repeat protein